MGTLRPGATIIYESPDNGKTVYGRYSGETNRWLVGGMVTDTVRDTKLWDNIFEAARSNRRLQEAIDRVKILYELSKKDSNGEEQIR